MRIVKYPRTPHLEGSGVQADDDPAAIRRSADGTVRTVIRVAELPEAECAARNRARPDPIPDTAVTGMLSAWEMPVWDEALVIEGRPPRLRPA